MMTSPDELKARHSFGDYVYWTLFFFIQFIAGLTAISRHSIPWLSEPIAVTLHDWAGRMKLTFSRAIARA